MHDTHMPALPEPLAQKTSSRVIRIQVLTLLDECGSSARSRRGLDGPQSGSPRVWRRQPGRTSLSGRCATPLLWAIPSSGRRAAKIAGTLLCVLAPFVALSGWQTFGKHRKNGIPTASSIRSATLLSSAMCISRPCVRLSVTRTSRQLPATRCRPTSKPKSGHRRPSRFVLTCRSIPPQSMGSRIMHENKCGLVYNRIMFGDKWSPLKPERGPLWIIAACFIGAATALLFLTPHHQLADLAILAGCFFIIANYRSHIRHHP